MWLCADAVCSCWDVVVITKHPTMIPQNQEHYLRDNGIYDMELDIRPMLDKSTITKVKQVVTTLCNVFGSSFFYDDTNYFKKDIVKNILDVINLEEQDDVLSMENDDERVEYLISLFIL